MASDGGAEVINFENEDVFDTLEAMTGGRGPDACIDAVGLEAHGATLDAYLDKAKTTAFLATDRPNALRQAIHAAAKAASYPFPACTAGFSTRFRSARRSRKG